ncbi:MAG: hypothetical protein OEW75_16715, partial [Cyclobacteriaceae bacterium]|nr:hypothetical protein [Cyclobacteriaceae bacterium]
MSFFSNLLLFILLLSLIACADDPISYNNDIRPILTTKCLSCHGGVKKNGGFSLLFESDALGLTASGAHAIIPGDPSNSELIKRISNPDPKLRMPYEKPPLSENEIELLKKWIKQG